MPGHLRSRQRGGGRTLFCGARFLNINVAVFDAGKHSAEIDLLDLRVRRRTAIPDLDRRGSANGVLQAEEEVNPAWATRSPGSSERSSAFLSLRVRGCWPRPMIGALTSAGPDVGFLSSAEADGSVPLRLGALIDELGLRLEALGQRRDQGDKEHGGYERLPRAHGVVE